MIAKAHLQLGEDGVTLELRLPDLVLLQVLLIVGLPWIGYAAKLGGSHVVPLAELMPDFVHPVRRERLSKVAEQLQGQIWIAPHWEPSIS